jgi:hypothetical protein
MEFEQAGLGASTCGAFKSASPLVTRPDRSPDSRGHMTPGRIGRFDRPRTRSGGEPLPLELFEQHHQRTIENRPRIAVRDLMTQKILDAAELVVGVPADGELHLESFRGEWLDLSTRRRRNGNGRCRGYARLRLSKRRQSHQWRSVSRRQFAN